VVKGTILSTLVRPNDSYGKSFDPIWQLAWDNAYHADLAVLVSEIGRTYFVKYG
jgi:hypothetical protein